MDKTQTRIRLVTQADFAKITGCHYSSASRLERGGRLPGPELLGTIVERFKLDQEEAFKAYTQGPEAFGKYLRHNVFFQYQDEEKDS